MPRTARTRTRPLLAAAAVAAVAAATITACTPTPPDAAPTTTASAEPTAAPWTVAIPVDPDALTAMFEELAAEMQVPGAAMLVRTPDGEITATYGVTEYGGSTPVSLDDHFRIGSNTKTWTGTVILQLVEEGKLLLDDPVSDYRPDVPNGDEITIADLLDMRSGLNNYTATYEMNRILDDDPQKAWDPEELAALGLSLPPLFAPGDGWAYSNTNTVLLGLIAEQLEGEPLGRIFAERIFTPLRLTETSFPAADDSSLPEPFVRGYMYGDNVSTIATAQLPPDLLVQAQDGTLAPNDQTDANPSWAWSAGGGISTIRDLATWVQALGSGELLDEATQQQRLDSLQDVPVTSLPEAKYGYGWAKFGPLLGHTGELPGYNSFMGYDPVNDVTIVVWASLAPLPTGRPPAADLGVELMHAVYGR